MWLRQFDDLSKHWDKFWKADKKEEYVLWLSVLYIFLTYLLFLILLSISLSSFVSFLPTYSIYYVFKIISFFLSFFLLRDILSLLYISAKEPSVLHYRSWSKSCFLRQKRRWNRKKCAFSCRPEFRSEQLFKLYYSRDILSRYYTSYFFGLMVIFGPLVFYKSTLVV